jgi:uncharacterized protein YkwD
MRRLLLLISIAFFLYFANGVVQTVRGHHDSHDPQVLHSTTAPASTDTLLNETNRYRAQHGLLPVMDNLQLHQAASAKCASMVALDYWSHDAPNGTEPWAFIKASGYQYKIAGENLAFGQQSQYAVVIDWMNSPKHRDNILYPDYTDVGHAICESQNYQGLGHK